MLSGVLPASLVNRPKRGLPAPLDGWLAGPGRLFMEDRVGRLKDRSGLFNPEAVEALKQQVARTPGAGMQLWSLFILDAWMNLLDLSESPR